jgi:hypothetical protein
MDGHQQARRPDSPTAFQPASVLDHPAMTKPAGGVARAIAFARGMSGKAVALTFGVFVLQAAMPAGSKPSDLIGSFHGNTESAELTAKQPVATDYERNMTDAKTGPVTKWQMEAEAFRQQQEAIAKSLETLQAAAQIADAACLAAPLVPLFMGNTREAREIHAAMQAACAEAERIRAEMTQIQVKAAREGSALMQRYRPGAPL